MVIRILGTEELEPLLSPLINEHFNEVDVRAESKMPDVQWHMYRHSIKYGSGFALGVFSPEAVCVGYLTAVLMPHPHTGVLTAIVDAFYIKPEYRNNGEGRDLIKHFESVSQSVGAKHFMVSVKHGVNCDKLLGDDYVISDVVMFKAV